MFTLEEINELLIGIGSSLNEGLEQNYAATQSAVEKLEHLQTQLLQELLHDDGQRSEC